MGPPPVYPPYRPVRRLGRMSRVIIGVFTAGLLIATTVVVSEGARTIVGLAVAVSAPALKKDASGVPTSEAGSKEIQPVHELGTNPLLGEELRLPQITCELPALGRSDDQLSAFYNAQLKCLDEAWDPVLRRVNKPVFTTKLQVWVPERSACGEAPDSRKALAYYCAGDVTIYAPSDWMLRAVGLYMGSHLATIAHEYGHHVQNESGILAAASAEMTSSDESSPQDLERVRRIELQANCFGALFIASAAGRGAITVSTANATIADYGNTNDSETHGSRKHQLSWARAGFGGRTTAVCNTWSAPASEVT